MTTTHAMVCDWLHALMTFRTGRRGLKGDNSSLSARIIAVTDAYDTMTSDRTYGKAASKEAAIHEMTRCAGTQFDPEIVRILIEKVLGEKWHNID